MSQGTLSSRRKPATPIAPSPALVAAAGWLLPGLGYWLVGERWRGLTAGITILAIFLGGLLIGGVRVIDVPGYDGNGASLAARRGAPSRNVLQYTFDKAWYIPQLLTGPITIGSSYASLQVARGGMPRSTARLWDIGVLYTAVAGMLNLFVLIDASHRAAKSREKHPRLVKM